MSSAVRPLQGGCACGRNVYVIRLPGDVSPHENISVILDNSSLTRRHTTSPFTPFLRIPLDWYHSGTYAFFADETHKSIRRTFTSPSDGPQAQRQFCGYCGTQLSTWSEESPSEAAFLQVNLGSLIDEDITRLERWGLLSSETDSQDVDVADNTRGSDDLGSSNEQLGLTTQPVTGLQHRGTPWFEEMVENSQFGRVRRQRGGYTSTDGSESLQWEIVEVGDDGMEVPVEGVGGSSSAKRKREDAAADGDVPMRG